MATKLTEIQWTEILLNNEITNEFDIDMFQAFYSFEEHKASAGHVGLLLGHKGKNPSAPLNSEVGRYAKRIAKYYMI